jgi:hypothetical protein
VWTTAFKFAGIPGPNYKSRFSTYGSSPCLAITPSAAPRHQALPGSRSRELHRDCLVTPSLRWGRG